MIFAITSWTLQILDKLAIALEKCWFFIKGKLFVFFHILLIAFSQAR